MNTVTEAKTKDYVISDIKLAKFGRQEIAIAETEMPGLTAIRDEYAARYVAKNIVASGLADKCLVQVSYAIGVAKPTSIMVDSFGTAKLSDEELSKIVMENFDLRPKGIVNMLDLLRPIYRKTAAYGHFGRTEPEFSWEKIDKKDLT